MRKGSIRLIAAASVIALALTVVLQRRTQQTQTHSLKYLPGGHLVAKPLA